MNYSSASRRVLACLFDTICILSIYLVFAFIFGIGVVFDTFFDLPIFGVWWVASTFLISWLYFAILESSPMQATIGKKLVGIRVVDLNGQRISFIRASARHFGKALSRLLLCFGLLMIFFTKKRQTLHDKLAKTLVIYPS